MVLRGYLAFATSLFALGFAALVAAAPAPHQAAGLGPILSSKFGGGIFGWDLNQNGTDGFLTEFGSGQSGDYFATETFNQTTAKITKVVSKKHSIGGNDEPFPEAIVGNDVGFVDVERDFVKGGRLFRYDRFEVMNPVSGNKLTGPSDPPDVYGIVPSFVTNNQSSSTQAMTVNRYRNSVVTTDLYLYNSATNAWLNPYEFPPNQVFAGYVLYAAVAAKTNSVLVSYQVGSGNREEIPPWFEVFDGSTGKSLRSFKGIGHGFLNGMAIDSTTGILCTTTFGDMEVEFYDVSTGKGFAVTIPGSGGALTNGAAVAVDQVHHLFFVAQQNSTFAPGSTVIEYDEKGNLIQPINGFSFLNNNSPLAVHIAVNGAARTGYAPGPNGNDLQSFTY